MKTRIKYRLLKDSNTTYGIVEEEIGVFMLSNPKICIEYIKGILQEEFIGIIEIISYDVYNPNTNYSCIDSDN